MEKYVTVSTGVRLEYVEQGDADGMPMVFLHGVTDSCRSFDPALRYLPPSVHAFALSQRGHGGSSRPDDGYTYMAMASDVDAFLDAVGLETAIIVGHSMGSMVAQQFVLMYPHRVMAVVLMGAFATLHGRNDMREFVESAIAPLTDPIDPVFAREWQVSTLARDIDPGFLDTVVSETVRVPARVWRQAFEGFLETPDFSSELADVSVPVLVMWGDRDTYARRADQDVFVATIPGVRLLTYPGGGHAFHWEDPARFARDLLEFTGSVVGAGAR